MSIIDSEVNTNDIVSRAMASLGGSQIAPFSSAHPDFSLDQAYACTAAIRSLREARGEKVVGRKIGFTNRTIWAEYGVYAPIWGYVYDTTLHELSDLSDGFSLDGLSEPRIEPEIVFRLAHAPDAKMDERELLSCVEWIAHGFELVQSVFPGWVFAPADTVAAFGLHGALLIGERHMVADDPTKWLEPLRDFSIALERDGEVVDRGHAGNVLGGPLSAIRHLVGLLAGDEVNAQLMAGEIVTTGTLTRAMPVQAGENWATTLSGLEIAGISARFR